jgi:aldehyde dehydrogenase (NAD+)
MEEGPAVMDVRDMFPPLTDKFKKQMTGLLERDKPIPAWVVGIINSLIKLRQKFAKA